jgi:5-methylthioadenosine/S-adenosylhomocysteine deaminase
MHRFYRSLLIICFVAASAGMRCAGQAGNGDARPQNADWILTGRYVLTMNDARRVIPDGAVAIQGHNIAAVGTKSEIEAHFRAKQRLDRPDAVLAPGLIDTHTHAPMSLMRGIADDKHLQEWLEGYIFPAESHNVSPEFVRWGTRLACLEMVLAGITTYTDMYYFEDTEAETAREAGVRGVLGQTIIGFPAPDYKTWQDSLAGAEKYVKKFRGDELITPAVAPHAIYTTPDDALRGARALADKYGVPLLIHLAETKKEFDDAMAQRKMTPTQVLEHLGLLNGRLVAAHAVWETPEDLELLRDHHTGVAHCPSSNTKLASGIAHVVDMLNLGMHVGLGTDGFAGSNDGADLLREMDLAAKLQKVVHLDPTVVPAEQAFAMATTGGAHVLGMEDKIGSLEAGKRADVIAISLANPDTVPLYNVYSVLVYSAHAPDVEGVFINGREIVRDRHVLTLQQDEILRQAELWKQKIEKSIPKQIPN